MQIKQELIFRGFEDNFDFAAPPPHPLSWKDKILAIVFFASNPLSSWKQKLN